MSVMIAGGAGQFGSVLAEALSKNHKVIALDLLLNGDSSRVKFGPLVKADARETGRVVRAFKEYATTHVFHCAMIADESGTPEAYDQNLSTTMSLLQAARESRIPCTVFVPMGRTRGMLERIIADTRAAGVVDADVISWNDENGLSKAASRAANSGASDPKR